MYTTTTNNGQNDDKEHKKSSETIPELPSLLRDVSSVDKSSKVLVQQSKKQKLISMLKSKSYDSMSNGAMSVGSKRGLPKCLSFDKVPKRGKRLEIYNLFKDPTSEPRIPLTDDVLKGHGYEFGMNIFGTQETVDQLTLPPVLQSHTSSESNLNNHRNEASVSLSSIGRSLSDPPLPLPSFDSTEQLVSKQTSSMEMKSSHPVREDLLKGSYRSRLNYTLLAKRLALEKGILEYEASTSYLEKQKHLTNKRLVTIGIPNKKFILGYNPKTAYGLLAVCNLILEKGCCTMKQAAEEYLKTTKRYSISIGVEPKDIKYENIISRLRLIITEQLPVIRISGQNLGILFLDGVQARQTYFFFPNFTTFSKSKPGREREKIEVKIEDKAVIEKLQKFIDLKLKYTNHQEKVEKIEQKRRKKKRKRLMKENEQDYDGRKSSQEHPLHETDLMLNQLQQFADDEEELELEKDADLEEYQFQEEDIDLIQSVYGSRIIGLMAFKNIQLQKNIFHMPNKQECMLM